jgi:hypothetical protein
MTPCAQVEQCPVGEGPLHAAARGYSRRAQRLLLGAARALRRTAAAGEEPSDALGWACALSRVAEVVTDAALHESAIILQPDGECVVVPLRSPEAVAALQAG